MYTGMPDRNGTLKLWDLKSGKLIRALAR